MLIRLRDCCGDLANGSWPYFFRLVTSFHPEKLKCNINQEMLRRSRYCSISARLASFVCSAFQSGNSKTDLQNAGLHDLDLPDNAVKLIADVANTCRGVTGVDGLRRIGERSADPRGVARRDQTPQSVRGRLCPSHRLVAPSHCSPRQSLHHLRGCLCTNRA